jgi:hypothetical protein
LSFDGVGANHDDDLTLQCGKRLGECCHGDNADRSTMFNKHCQVTVPVVSKKALLILRLDSLGTSDVAWDARSCCTTYSPTSAGHSSRNRSSWFSASHSTASSYTRPFRNSAGWAGETVNPVDGNTADFFCRSCRMQSTRCCGTVALCSRLVTVACLVHAHPVTGHDHVIFKTRDDQRY